MQLFRRGIQENGGLSSSLTAESLDRLDRIVSAQQNTLQNTRDEVTAIKVETSTLRRDISALSDNLSAFVKEWQISRKPNLNLLTPVSGVLTFIIGVATFYITSQITAATVPLKQELVTLQTQVHAQGDDVRNTQVETSKNAQTLLNNSATITEYTTTVRRLNEDVQHLQSATAGSAEADANSRTDRAHLNQVTQQLADDTSHQRAELSTLRALVSARLLEVETQFKAISDIANLRAAVQERFNAETFEHLNPGLRYPSSIFFPPSVFNQAPPGLDGDSPH